MVAAELLGPMNLQRLAVLCVQLMGSFGFVGVCDVDAWVGELLRVCEFV